MHQSTPALAKMSCVLHQLSRAPNALQNCPFASTMSAPPRCSPRLVLLTSFVFPKSDPQRRVEAILFKSSRHGPVSLLHFTIKGPRPSRGGCHCPTQENTSKQAFADCRLSRYRLGSRGDPCLSQNGYGLFPVFLFWEFEPSAKLKIGIISTKNLHSEY